MSSHATDLAVYAKSSSSSTTANWAVLLELMGDTREERRHWIDINKPSITEVLAKYPRLQDIDTAVSCVDRNVG